MSNHINFKVLHEMPIQIKIKKFAARSQRKNSGKTLSANSGFSEIATWSSANIKLYSKRLLITPNICFKDSGFYMTRQ
jgi:hypothetical protein